MRHSASILVVAVMAVASCSTRPTAPTAATTWVLPQPVSVQDSSSASAVTTERIRLQRVGGPDIMTTMVTGQVIDVPLNVDLRIWAEIRRLESDFVRLVVDWGDGNKDFFPCGACRVDNKYTRNGRYEVTAKLVDQNAPSGTAPILSVTVTLNAYDFDPAPTPTPLPLPCPGVATSFQAVAHVLAPPPAGTITITFAGLSGLPMFSPFSTYSESGFTVSPASGCWKVDGYGNPGPSIVFQAPTSRDEVRITAGGSSFTFGSVDLYSSVTPIPYTITGFLNSSPVFTVANTVPNTFGTFKTVSNPYSAATIDALVIALSNPAPASCCNGNPVGLDNIVLTR